MNLKKFLLILSIALFAGCSSKSIARGASPDQVAQLPVVMVANTDITCVYTYIKKGTIFSIKEIGGIEYKIQSNAGLLGDTLNMFSGGNTYTFADNVLLLPGKSNLKESVNSGYIVYPNGKFAYDDYYAAGYNPTGDNWWLVKGSCEFDGEFPFTLKDNR